MTNPTQGYVDVWAQSKDVPTRQVCGDARLHWHGDSSGPVDTSSPGMPFVKLNNTWGQPGWDRGVNYMSDSDLLLRLRKLKADGKIKGVRRLAIHAHGTPGKVFINGLDAKPIAADTKDLRPFLRQLRTLFPAHGGELQFVGCLAAQNSPDLLEAVSLELPNVTVVAYETVGYTAGDQNRDGEKCYEPGMRVTPFHDNSKTRLRQQFYDRNWSNLGVLPWATPRSRHAAVAINGRIIKHAISTRMSKEDRKKLRKNAAPRTSAPVARRQAEGAGLGVELTDDEAIVFAKLPGWQGTPIPPGNIAFVSGLPQHRAQQAITRLVRKLLAMLMTKGEVSGYVRVR